MQFPPSCARPIAAGAWTSTAFRRPPSTLTDTREYGDTEELVAYAGVNATTFGGKLQNRIGFAYTDTDRENIDPDSPVPTTFDATGRNERWEYQGTLTLNDIVGGVFGLESEHSELNTRSPSEFDPNPVPLAHDARLDSVYAQLSISPIESLTLTAGMRYDDHDTFGNESTGRATLAWAATPTTIVRASYGEGFKAPTLFQLFSEFGNEALTPERADAWDAGIEQHLLDDSLLLSATYFGRNTRDMIDFVSCFANTDPRCTTRPFGFYDNVQKTEVDGFELGLVAHLGERLRFDANYTDMETTNRGAGANFGRELPRRPGQTLNGELAYQWPIGLTTTVAVTHAGRSFDNASNTVVVDAYTVVDLRAAFALRDDLELYGRLENAFDEEYETIARLRNSRSRRVRGSASELLNVQQRACRLQRAASPIMAGGSALHARCSPTCSSRGSICRRASIRAPIPHHVLRSAHAIGCPTPRSSRVSKHSPPRRSVSTIPRVSWRPRALNARCGSCRSS